VFDFHAALPVRPPSNPGAEKWPSKSHRTARDTARIGQHEVEPDGGVAKAGFASASESAAISDPLCAGGGPRSEQKEQVMPTVALTATLRLISAEFG
jgi:hypothetical protein